MMTDLRRNVFTYEEIARKYDITTTKVQTIVKSTYNKIIKLMLEDGSVNIFQAVLALQSYLGITEVEAFDKLNDEHKEMIKRCAMENFNMKEDQGTETDFTSLFE